MIDKQEIFDKAWDHFITNKSPRAIEAGSCCYRTPEGKKCAIGIFIPDDLYYEEVAKYEGQVFKVLPTHIKERIFPDYDPAEDTLFLIDLQHFCHDRGENEHMEFRIHNFKIIAKNHGLKVPSDEV